MFPRFDPVFLAVELTGMMSITFRTTVIQLYNHSNAKTLNSPALRSFSV